MTIRMIELFAGIGATHEAMTELGLDVRLLDSEIAERLSILHPFKPWKFAYDDKSVLPWVSKGIDLLRDVGIDLKHNVEFYVYCHGQEQVRDAVDRCRYLKENGVTAYSMCNMDRPLTPDMKKLKRWTRPMIFWTIDYEEYA